MCSSTDNLDSSLVLNEPGSSRTSPSRLPRMFVENHPLRPIMRALKPGARLVLIRVCAVLKVLRQMGGEDGLYEGFSGLKIFAADGFVVLAGQLVHYGNVYRKVGGAVSEGHAF